MEKYGSGIQYFLDFESKNIALIRYPVIFKEKETRNRILKCRKKDGLGASCSYPMSLNEFKGTEPYVISK